MIEKWTKKEVLEYSEAGRSKLEEEASGQSAGGQKSELAQLGDALRKALNITKEV